MMGHQYHHPLPEKKPWRINHGGGDYRLCSELRVVVVAVMIRAGDVLLLVGRGGEQQKTWMIGVE